MKWWMLCLLPLRSALAAAPHGISLLGLSVALQSVRVASRTTSELAGGGSNNHKPPANKEGRRRLLHDDAPETIASTTVENPVTGVEFQDAQVDPNIPPGLEELELLAFRLEYAEEETLDKLIEWSYNWVVQDRGYRDGHLRARDLPDFLHRTLNPAEEDIDDEERALLNDASSRLRHEQGLHDDGMILYVGFLSRGSPLRYMRSLAHVMHHQHQARRLQAVKDL